MVHERGLNAFDKYKRRKQTLQLLDSCYNRDINKFKDANNNTDIHDLVKYLVFRELKKQGHEVIVEARFLYNKGRADILDLTERIVYEIVMTEKEESILRKKQDYPLPLEVINAKEYISKNKFIKKLIKGK